MFDPDKDSTKAGGIGQSQFSIYIISGTYVKIILDRMEVALANPDFPSIYFSRNSEFWMQSETGEP